MNTYAVLDLSTVGDIGAYLGARTQQNPYSKALYEENRKVFNLGCKRPAPQIELRSLKIHKSNPVPLPIIYNVHIKYECSLLKLSSIFQIFPTGIPNNQYNTNN